ncbi:Golgi transport complex subunit 3, partial [Quaeritorhiza haematococci]
MSTGIPLTAAAGASGNASGISTSATAAAAARSLRVDDWEARAPLEDKQKDSILHLQDLCAEFPIPDEFATDNVPEDAPDQPPDQSSSAVPPSPAPTPPPPLPWRPTDAHNSTPNLSSSPSQPSSFTSSATTLHTDPIETTQQFFTWFSHIEEEMEKGQEDIYRSYLEALHMYRATCDEILGQVGACEQVLDRDLMRNWKFVEEKSKALKMACENLLEEQTNLVNVAEQLSSKLAYFSELEPITKLFSSPGDVCLDERFIPTLKRLDECLSFVGSHLRYRDAELYQMKFRQCMTRGMTLIKMHFVNAIRTLFNDIREKLSVRPAGEPLNASVQTSLFYVKFRTQASKLRKLVAELETRCEGHREYLALHADCLNAYFSARRQILSPYIAIHVQNLSQGADTLTFARNGCAYIITLCSDEYNLFYQFFELGEEELVEYLDSLASHLYEHLRPMILREIRIDTLSELCHNLQVHLLSSSSATSPNTSSASLRSPLTSPIFPESNPFSTSSSTVGDGSGGGANGGGPDGGGGEGATNGQLEDPVKVIVKRILEDAQQRLVFRVQAFVESEIKGFKPRDEEIAVLARTRGFGVTPVLSSVPGVSQMASSTTTSSAATPSSFNPPTTTSSSSAAVLTATESDEPPHPSSKSSNPNLFASSDAASRIQRQGAVLNSSGRLDGGA